MAKKLIKYQLDNGSIPAFISNGGYFPIGSELIGVCEGDLPEGYVAMDRDDVMLRALEIYTDGNGNFITDFEGTTYSEQLVEELVQNFLESVGMPDLA